MLKENFELIIYIMGNQNILTENNKRINEIVGQLRQKIKIAQFFGRVYFVLDDWSYVVCLIITIISPFAFAVLIYFPAAINNIGIISLLVSAFGSLISVIRVATKLGERSVFVLKRKANLEFLLSKILLKMITIEEIVIELQKIELSEIDEPHP
ncbi:MAG: hypothetical protein AB2L26_03040 [Ignavibacteria bacterium]